MRNTERTRTMPVRLEQIPNLIIDKYAFHGQDTSKDEYTNGHNQAITEMSKRQIGLNRERTAKKIWSKWCDADLTWNQTPEHVKFIYYTLADELNASLHELLEYKGSEV